MSALSRLAHKQQPSAILSGLSAIAVAAVIGMTATPPPVSPVATETMMAEGYADITTTVPDTQALAAQSLSLRTGTAASRDSARVAVPDLAATAVETAVGEALLTVHVTPAPIPCAFTGLTHLAFDDALCTTPSNNTPEQNQALGRYLAALRGWEGNQFQCLDNLITRESRWRHTAANPVTSARGIPQKMMSVHYGANWSSSPVAAEWLANPEPQIEWGLDYIARRYSDPCGAWGFFQRNGWY